MRQEKIYQNTKSINEMKICSKILGFLFVCIGNPNENPPPPKYIE